MNEPINKMKCKKKKTNENVLNFYILKLCEVGEPEWKGGTREPLAPLQAIQSFIR